MKTSIFTSILVSAVILVFLVMTGYGLVRDVDALVDRAQVAADREDMTEYIQELKGNLEERDMTNGHFVLIFKTPANDLALHYKTVNRLLERLESIRDIPKNDTAYQVALDDIRGTIRELPNPALDYLWVKYWFLYLLGFGIWIWPVVRFMRPERERHNS